MYIPSLNAESRPDVIFDFIEAHSLGALVTSGPSGELFATHLPWLVDRTNGDHSNGSPGVRSHARRRVAAVREEMREPVVADDIMHGEVP